jgi:hypothetical protein
MRIRTKLTQLRRAKITMRSLRKNLCGTYEMFADTFETMLTKEGKYVTTFCIPCNANDVEYIAPHLYQAGHDVHAESVRLREKVNSPTLYRTLVNKVGLTPQRFLYVQSIIDKDTNNHYEVIEVVKPSLAL